MVSAELPDVAGCLINCIYIYNYIYIYIVLVYVKEWLGLIDLSALQGWASITAGQARGLCVHGLTLSTRSEGSRHERGCLES